MKLKNTEPLLMVCKYFTGIQDRRYGDLQSVRPVSNVRQFQSVPEKYDIAIQNGFLNLTLDNQFLWKTLTDFTAGKKIPHIPEPVGAALCSDAYRAYIFSNYIWDFWKKPETAPKFPSEDFEQTELRRLSVMAFFLIESEEANNPHLCSRPFASLYAIFSKNLYTYLSTIPILGAPALAQRLTAAALILRACPAGGTCSSYMPPRPAD